MWPNPQVFTDLVLFTEEILDEKLNFLCGVYNVLMSPRFTIFYPSPWKSGSNNSHLFNFFEYFLSNQDNETKGACYQCYAKFLSY